MTSEWTIHKFGGTSLANANCYRTAAEIILSRASDQRSALVVSAMSVVTNTLIQSVTLAASQDKSYLSKLQDLKDRHLQTITELQLKDSENQSLRETIDSDFSAIEEVLRGVWITGLAPDRIVEFVSGHGELWSAQMMH